jgi:predicted lipid-binding transport protein (Tim44 family)
MRSIAMIAGLTVAIAAAPAAEAACQKRTNGTVIGALGGALLGSAVAGRGDRTEGALIGGAAGGLVGNQVSKCRRAAPRYSSRPTSPQRAAYAERAPTCRYENRAYYDAYGEVVYQPTRVCR